MFRLVEDGLLQNPWFRLLLYWH